eukprot:TRINITY_DN21197_c3_g4_i1.p1 TRINITY_DN21197_c3_g4~~TRINITY_DN21197_c3_g4_i1.p1  ORF type:complete len:391 (-),score=36.13 TRINITY_DN21197_c3_g4_i1:1158-2330(-)
MLMGTRPACCICRGRVGLAHRRHAGVSETNAREGASPLSLQQLERRCRRLRAVLRDLVFPKLSHITAFGERHELPVRASKAHEHKHVSMGELQYLGGFFDGDGCVSPLSRMTGCTLAITQSADRSEILIRYYKAFGGGLYNERKGTGLAKACARWVAHGAFSKAAALRLAQVTLLKRKQLLIAARWPSCKHMRSDAVHQLQSLKHEPETTQGRATISWQYVAGFFDAEGCIRIPPDTLSLHLHISQKPKEPLELIAAFLTERLPGINPGVHLHGAGHVLSITCTSHCIFVLRRLMAAGLCLKRKQAEAALAVCHSDHANIRAALSLLGGNQSRYRRLNEAGCYRSRQISTASKKLRAMVVSGASDHAEAQSKLLADLRAVHSLQSAADRY